MTTAALPARLAVTPGSVSEMLSKLDERGLVALEVVRHHRLLELYLAEQLDVPWHRVHEEAEALEHVLSEDLEARIAAKLGDPTHDPHGDPTPTAELQIDERETARMADLSSGDCGRFVRVSDSDPAMLRYLDERDLQLGDRFEVLDRQPFSMVR